MANTRKRKKKKDDPADMVVIDAFAPEAVATARELYITSPDPISLRKLSERFKGAPGMSLPNLERYCSNEDWVGQREKYRQAVHEDLVIRSRPQAVTQRLKNLKARQLVVDVATKSIVKRFTPKEDGGLAEVMTFSAASNAIARHAPVLEEEMEYSPLMPEPDKKPGEDAPLTDDELDGIMEVPNTLTAARAEEEGETV